MDPTQLEEFKELGYTVLKSVHGDESMAGWRATQDYLQTTTLRPNVRHGLAVPPFCCWRCPAGPALGRRAVMCRA
jgi:hypothetical protein